MHREKNADRRFRWGSGWMAGGLLLLLLILGQMPLALAAQDSNQSGKETPMAELLKLPGRVLAEGRSTKAVGPHKVATYRVEEVALPQPAQVEIRGQQVEVDKAYRITITGGPFAVRALPPTIWINDAIVGYGQENEDLSAITVVTFDRSLLRDGATVSLSYGKNKEDRTSLPEKLKLSGN